VARDPRFDDLSGKFNEEMFNKVYTFVDEIKTKEKKVKQTLFILLYSY
jgi:ribosomal RNA-processing protein 36